MWFNIITQITEVTQIVEPGILVQRKKKSFAFGVGRIENVIERERLLWWVVGKECNLINRNRLESNLVREKSKSVEIGELKSRLVKVRRNREALDSV